MIELLKRLQARKRLIFNHGAELNRRVEIESKLMSIACGKSKTPSREECRIFSLKLGTPKENWSKKWKA